MIAPIFTLLAADSATTAIIGTNPVRCYPAGNIPEVTGTDPNANLPCVSWQTVGGTVTNLLGDRPGADHQRVQIDCWALTFSAVTALSDAVQTALELHGYCVSVTGHDYEPDTKRYRSSSDWTFWTPH